MGSKKFEKGKERTMAKTKTALAPKSENLPEAAETARNAVGKKLQQLIDPDTNLVLIETQQQADVGASILNVDIPRAREILFPIVVEPAQKLHKLWKEAVALRDKYVKPIDKWDEDIRAGLGRFKLMEDRKRAAEAERLQKLADKKMPGQGVVVQIEETRVEGMSFPVRKKAKVVDLKKLCKQIAAGRAPLLCVEVDEAFLNGKAKEMWDTTEPDRRGKRLIWDGAVELYEDQGTSRR